MRDLLQSNMDMFVWSTTDMLGILSSTITHELNIDHRARSVRQKTRKFSMDKINAAEEEINKLLNADYIKEVQYLEWLSNVVLAKKANCM